MNAAIETLPRCIFCDKMHDHREPCPRQGDILLSEMQHLAETIHQRAYSHVPQWRVSSDCRGVLSQIDNMTAGLIERIDNLNAAISWVEPPFIDDATSESEIRNRIKFLVSGAARANGEPKA